MAETPLEKLERLLLERQRSLYEGDANPAPAVAAAAAEPALDADDVAKRKPERANGAQAERARARPEARERAAAALVKAEAAAERARLERDAAPSGREMTPKNLMDIGIMQNAADGLWYDFGNNTATRINNPPAFWPEAWRRLGLRSS
jgi:hypothetical protein